MKNIVFFSFVESRYKLANLYEKLHKLFSHNLVTSTIEVVIIHSYNTNRYEKFHRFFLSISFSSLIKRKISFWWNFQIFEFYWKKNFFKIEEQWVAQRDFHFIITDRKSFHPWHPRVDSCPGIEIIIIM